MYTNTREAADFYLIGAIDEEASALDTESCWPKVWDLSDRIPFLTSDAHNMLVKNLVQYIATAYQKH
jgi:hypothetical protein